MPADYLPHGDGPWRLTMGLRRLDPARWLEVDRRRADELAAKDRLLAGDHAAVVAVRPGSAAAGAELLDIVVDHLERHHPGVVARLPGAVVEDLATGRRTDLAAWHPVDAAARLVQEDLCLLEPAGGTWVLSAASVCFPSRWSLADKIGRDLRAIHRPVPGYEDRLAAPTDSTFDRLRPDRPGWRLNWTMLDRPDLHQPADGERGRSAPLDPGRDLWVRVERQTLRRLTAHPAVVFTIRTYVAPLGEVVAAHPEVGRHLAAVLPTVPAATLAYKGWSSSAGTVLDWLAQGAP